MAGFQSKPNFGFEADLLDAQPGSCGVEFDEKCLESPTEASPTVTPDFYEEYLGECEAGEETCPPPRKSLSKEPSQQRAATEKTRFSLKTTVSDVRKLSLTTPSGQLLPGIKPDTPYEGLPEDYYKRKFKPDYPHELKMKVGCKPKAVTKKSAGATKTQPVANFLPDETQSAEKVESIYATILDEPSVLAQNRMPPPVLSSSDELVVDWLHDHNVQIMMEYFLGLCVVHKPDNPWNFISQLCNKMIEARTDLEAFDTIPRLLTPDHTEAIFRIFDRVENGYITVSQYKAAMEAMGLSKFSLRPDGIDNNQITKDTFVKEATDAVNESLRSFMIFEGVPVPEAKAEEGEPRKNSMATDSESSYSSSGDFSDEGDEEEAEEQQDLDDYDRRQSRQSYEPLSFGTNNVQEVKGESEGESRV